MKFLILGAGALGGYYGGMLIKGGADVTFLLRPKTAAKLDKFGLKLRLKNGDFQPPIKIITPDMQKNQYDIIFLTCKAYDVKGAINSIAPSVGPKTAVLPILNGINHIDMLAERFGAHSILGGVTQFLVNQADDGTILPTLHGSGGQKTLFGEMLSGTSQRCASILDEMKKTMPDTAISDNILKKLWAKISGAGASFAVASLLHARAGKVAAAPAGHNVVAGIFDECAAICLAEGYPPPDGMRNVLLNDLWGKINSDYGPSLLADIENGQPTEGEHVIGDLVRRAKKFKLKTPLLEASLCRIQIYERGLQER